MFGAGATQSSSLFATPTTTSSIFNTPAPSAFATPSSTPSFAPGGFTGNTLFSTPQQQQQQQTPSLFQQQPQQQQQQQSGGFGFQSAFATPQQQQQQPQQQQQSNALFQGGGGQLTTQMAPVAPLPFSLSDRDLQAIVDAFKEDPGNTKYAFKHLLFSVIEPQYRVKPAGVSDIMWAEATGKLEGMDSNDRERLWPQLVQGFKDLSQRLKIQDEVIVSDAERLRVTQSNVKMLQRHFQADTLPWIQRLRQKEQSLQRRLLRVMRLVEALESKGCRLPFTKGEAELAEKLAAITRQLKGSGAELSRRVQNLLTVSKMQSYGIGSAGGVYLPGSTKIHEQSLADMQEVLDKQTEAISRLGNVLKRDVRDMEIIMSEDTLMRDDLD